MTFLFFSGMFLVGVFFWVPFCWSFFVGGGGLLFDIILGGVLSIYFLFFALYLSLNTLLSVCGKAGGSFGMVLTFKV